MMRQIVIGAALTGVMAWTAGLIAQQPPATQPALTPSEPARAASVQTLANAEQPVRLMTYNVENWQYSFMAFHVSKTTQPTWPEAALELIARERREDEEDNWEVARTVLEVKPDIWVLQEGCDKADLEYFNKSFLQSYFETLHIFKTNTERGQNTAILLRPGFKVITIKEDYYKEPETDDVNPLFDKLFARGPGFVLVEAPNGKRFWVGTNHAKSKSGNDLPVTKWRNAEAERTNQIVNELRRAGPRQVFFLGDMNDELGMDKFETEAGRSAIETIAGTGSNALTILTKPLVDKGEISFGGYRSSRHRSFIDHAFATPEAAQWVKGVSVYRGGLADVASDHYPVVVDVVVK